MADLRGKTALVTGASSGLGREFAVQLAGMGAELVLTARREDRLDALGRELPDRFGVPVTVVPLDLTADGAPAALFEVTEGRGQPVDVLVNNAGFATLAPFLDIPLERTVDQLRLNVVALSELTWRFGRAMRARGGGHILNVASFAGFTPVPYFATYAAGKAYVRSLSEAAAHELASAGVRVCALCPSGVATEFWDVAGDGAAGGGVQAALARPEAVVAAGLRGLFDGRASVLPGPLNQLNAFVMRFLPRGFLVRMTGKVMARR
ncbi:MAG: SDR family oxidoreductase [Myxococcota bacterium]|jgi:hypothetical protein|nr:SDR family oxidoreductase [Myxococcota bacterium]